MTRRGFTMVELIIYMTIIGFVGVVYTSFTADVFKSARRSRIAESVQENTQLVMNQIAQDIRTAQSIQPITSPTSLTINTSPTTTLAYIVTVPNISREAVSLFPADVQLNSASFVASGTGVTVTLVTHYKNDSKELTLSSTIYPRQQLYQ